MSDIRVGVVGFGNMGRHHCHYISAGDAPGAALTAIVDNNPKVLADAKAKYENVAVYDSYEALIEANTVDAVIIATPHYFHPPAAILALEHGLHVLIEKPAGVYTKQVRLMNEAAAASDKVFGIMFNQRTLGVHQKMREIVQSGQLGKITRTSYTITDWFRTQAYYDSGGWRATWAGEGGGVLLNQSPHNMDLWQWIAGMPKKVRAFCGFGRRHNIEVEDDVTAYVEYENGATGVFITSTGDVPGSNILEISGDQGKLVLQNGKITFYRTETPVGQFLREDPGAFSQPPIWTCDIPAGGGEGHVGITKNWISAIQNGTPLLAPGQDGINQLQLANAMLLSTWLDDWVEIPVDEELYLAKLEEKIKNSTYAKVQASGKVFSMAGSF